MSNNKGFKILIIEDDLMMLRNIKEYLISNGYQCSYATSIEEGRKLFDKYFYHAIVLDLGLPDGDGLSCIPFIKSVWNQTGIIIVSARDKLDDRLEGLDLGADDYLIKPFHLTELNARLNALLRRYNSDDKKSVVFEEIKIDLFRNEIMIGDTFVEFSKKEFDLMLYFVENKNRVLSKESLFEHVWGENPVMMDNPDFIYVHINRLRKKLSHYTSNKYLKTVRGFGYKLELH